MALPISSQVYIPNPMNTLEARRTGASLAADPTAAVISGGMAGFSQGFGFVNSMMNDQTNRETARASSQNQQQQGQLNREKFDFESGPKFEADQAQRAETNRMGQQKLDDNRANQISRESRLRTNQALSQQKASNQARYDSAMASAVADGNPDPLVSLINSDATRADTLSKTIKGDAKMGQAAVDSIESAIKKGRLTADQLPSAQAALEVLRKAPGIYSSQERLEGASSSLEGLTGARIPQDATSIKFGTPDPNDSSGTRSLEFQRQDGSIENIPVFNFDPKVHEQINKQVNMANQALRNQREIEERLKAPVQQVAETQAKQKQVDAQEGNQEAPAGAEKRAGRLTQLGSGSPVDSIRNRLREKRGVIQRQAQTLQRQSQME